MDFMNTQSNLQLTKGHSFNGLVAFKGLIALSKFGNSTANANIMNSGRNDSSRSHVFHGDLVEKSVTAESIGTPPVIVKNKVIG